MRKNGHKKGDNMQMIIEEIILVEKSANNSFLKIQQKRLTQLKEIESNKQKGKRIQKSRIVKELQSSGILDSNGNLSKHYFSED